MSMSPPPSNPYDSPETVKPGMSGGTKVLLGVGVGCGVLVLLCCGGLGVGGFFFGRSVQQGFSTEPTAIRTVTDSIVSIEIPPPLEPEASFEFNLPVVGTKMMAMAIWDDSPNVPGETSQPGDASQPDSSLVLFQMDPQFGDHNALRLQLDMQMQQRGRKGMNEIRIKDPEIIEVEIHGVPAEFEFGKGQRGDSHEIWQAAGSFEGKTGPAILIMQLSTDKFSEDQAREILSSMSKSVTDREMPAETEPPQEAPAEIHEVHPEADSPEADSPEADSPQATEETPGDPSE